MSIAFSGMVPVFSVGAEPSRSAATEVSSGGYKELESVDSVVQPASTIFELRETADLSKVKKLRVNIVLAAVDKALNVVYGSEKLCSVAEFIAETSDFSVPAFEVEEEESLSSLLEALKENGTEDVFIVSKKPELLYSARKQFPLSRGALDLRGRELSADEIVKAVNEGFSKIVFLDAGPLTAEFVNSLRKRYLSVWAEDRGSTANSAVKTILTGVNGIATDSPQTYSEAYRKFFGKPNSVVRDSFIIGHRICGDGNCRRTKS